MQLWSTVLLVRFIGKYYIDFLLVLFRFSCIAVVAAGLVACSGSGSSDQKQQATAIQIIQEGSKITGSKIYFTSIGSTIKLDAKGVNANGDAVENQPSFAWDSSNPQIVSISEIGELTAIAEGQTTIHVSTKSIQSSLTAIVTLGGVHITGVVTFEDKEYGRYGFTGSTNAKPVRFAIVDMQDGENNTINSQVTDEFGEFTILVTEYTVAARVLAQTDPQSGFDISIKDFSSDVYAAVKSINPNAVVDPFQINITVASSVAGAFNILDVFTSGEQFITSAEGHVDQPLNAFWEYEKSTYGTYYCWSEYSDSYCPGGSGIYIYGGGDSYNDTDEFDDDVLWHEFGHFMESSLGIVDSPGGRHYLTDNDLDLRLAWSEGWGDYFPGAIKQWLWENNPERLSTPDSVATSRYIDTRDTSTYGISMDILNPGVCYSGLDCYIYSSNEIAIAKIMLRMTQRYGIHSMWDVYSNYLSVSENAASIETFWDGWLALYPPQDEAGLLELEDLFSERFVYFKEDTYESDNVAESSRKVIVCAADPCVGESHYLYRKDGNSDKDVIGFDAIAGYSYMIDTHDLKNGADTHLRLLDDTQSAVYDLSSSSPIENDDRPGTTYSYPTDNPPRIHNDDSMFSSMLTFTANKSGMYYVEISNPLGELDRRTGRYGSYRIRIKQQ